MFPIACFPICRTPGGLLALAFALAAAGGEPPSPIGNEQPWAAERAAMPIRPQAEKDFAAATRPARAVRGAHGGQDLFRRGSPAARRGSLRCVYEASPCGCLASCRRVRLPAEGRA